MDKKKRKNWLEKFQDFWWDELTVEQRNCLWPVLTTLRGPDRDSERATNLKHKTTARIRYLLLGKKPDRMWRYGWVLEIEDNEGSAPTDKAIKKSCGLHFLDHIYSAIQRLKGVVKKSKMKDLLEIFQEEKKE